MTNPDNVGGLLPCPFCGGEAELVGGEQDEFCHWHVQCTVCGAISGESLAPSTPDRDFASESWNRRELCRAAPAGGDVVAWMVTENSASHYSFLTREQAESEASVYGSGVDVRVRPLVYGDSAPAGSGEVEQMAKRLDDARAIEEETSGLEDTIDAMRTAAALLRKLQQGAE